MKVPSNAPEQCNGPHDFLKPRARWMWYEEITAQQVWGLCDQCAQFVMDSPTTYPVVPIPGRGRD